MRFQMMLPDKPFETLVAFEFRIDTALIPHVLNHILLTIIATTASLSADESSYAATTFTLYSTCEYRI